MNKELKPCSFCGSTYIDVNKKIEEITKGIESVTRLIENRPYDEEAK